MKVLGRKLKDYGNGHVAFECPGCGQTHALRVEGDQRPRWDYNGNPDAPTFRPSIKAMTGHYVGGQKQPPDCPMCNDRDFEHSPCGVCHFFVADGVIDFLGDCTHSLAGQKVPMADIAMDD